MGEELIPFPLVRVRGSLKFCHKDSHLEAHDEPFCKALWRCDEFETTSKIRVKSNFLGCCRTILTVASLGLCSLYYLMIDKTYLQKASITGFARIGIQHPVKDGCNPIDPTCRADFKTRDQLSYCDSSKKHGEHATNCTYFDQFALAELETGMAGSTFLIPTRISTYIQQVDVECAKKPDCSQIYSVLEEYHDFVADIEDYTLLIDHSYASEELYIHGRSWTTPGFFKNCSLGSDQTKCVDLLIPCVGECDNAFASYTEQAVMSGYDASGKAGGGIVSRMNGDIFRVKDIMQMAHIDLDDVQGEGGNKDTKGAVRYEGEAVVLEIHYLNYKKWHTPNSLPVVYEYIARRMPAETYKTTRMFPYGNDGTKRRVVDMHGILLTTRVVGTLGKADLFNMMTMFLEVVAFLGLLNWILSCMALNWTRHKSGDEFFEKVHEKYDLVPRDIESESEEPDARSEEVRPLNQEPRA